MMSDQSGDDDFVNPPSSCSRTTEPVTPSTSSKRKAATPTSSKSSKKKKGDDDDAKEEELPTFKFLKLDSDEDDNEEDELVVKQEWAMVESKEGGTRYFRGTPTSPPERGYVNRKINLREDKAGTDWWKITKALSTAKRMSNKSEDEGDNKLREFICTLARTVDRDEEMGSQQSTISDLTPLTPEFITGRYPPLTAAERKIAETKIRQAGADGLMVPGTTSRVAWSPPNQNRAYGLFVYLKPNTKYNFICAEIPNCVKTTSTIMEQIPRCEIHKGKQIGFVLCQFTDGANKKHNVILHVIASFTHSYGDEKQAHATRAINSQINKSVWNVYSKERKAAKKPVPELVELEERRLYFDDEDELMKIYSARQTTTLFQLLLWPDTTIKIICLHVNINLPNGAYKELVDEMDLCGMELRIHDKLSSSAVAAITLEESLKIPFLIRAEKGESIGTLLSHGKNKMKEKIAALYFFSSPYVIYAGQALKSGVHGNSFNHADPIVDYKNNKPPSHPDPKIVPIGLVRDDERYKWECHLQICALIASLLRLRNCINPSDFSAQSHPLCINRQINSSFVDKKSWGIVHGYLMEKFSVDVSLGPKVSDQE